MGHVGLIKPCRRRTKGGGTPLPYVQKKETAGDHYREKVNANVFYAILHG